jgi:imidazolonepropionase-like amidohydrolase
LGSFLLALFPGLAAAACPEGGSLIIGPLRIVDVETGEIRTGRALQIENGLITREFNWAGEAARYGDIPVVDGAGRYAMPGLIDAHVHTLWAPGVPESFFAAFLDHGVTSIRDMGGDPGLTINMRQAARTCALEAPNLIAPGPFLDGPEPVDPSLSMALSSADDVRDAVEELAADGADFLKVYTLLPPELLGVLIDEAAARGLRVSGHLPAGVQAGGALSGRMQTIEHMAIETGGICSGISRTDCLNRLQSLALDGVLLTPTLIVRRASTDMARGEFDVPDIPFPAIVGQFWLGQQQSARSRADADWFEQREASLAELAWLTRAYIALGGDILAGSDAGNPFVFPGAGLHDELALLVEAGLTPLQALQAATVHPARLFPDQPLGRIAPGYRADFILLADNPLTDITATRRIEAVYLNGVMIDD